MATFHPNPNEEFEPWIERAALEGSIFRIWHLMFFCFAIFSVLLIMICCCVKIRIPRTKQEIEADYRRKKLAEKFRQRLRLIPNHEMDAIDLKCALEIIHEDYRNENRNITEQFSSKPFASGMMAEPQQPPNEEITGNKKFASKIANIINVNKMKTNPQAALESGNS